MIFFRNQLRGTSACSVGCSAVADPWEFAIWELWGLQPMSTGSSHVHNTLASLDLLGTFKLTEERECRDMN
eukprot:3010011-Amphidinium_carterae.1